MKEKQMNDVLLTGGGIIPEDDMKKLQSNGRWKFICSGHSNIRDCRLYKGMGKRKQEFLKEHFMYKT